MLTTDPTRTTSHLLCISLHLPLTQPHLNHTPRRPGPRLQPLSSSTMDPPVQDQSKKKRRRIHLNCEECRRTKSKCAYPLGSRRAAGPVSPSDTHTAETSRPRSADINKVTDHGRAASVSRRVSALVLRCPQAVSGADGIICCAFRHHRALRSAVACHLAEANSHFAGVHRPKLSTAHAHAHPLRLFADLQDWRTSARTRSRKSHSPSRSPSPSSLRVSSTSRSLCAEMVWHTS